MRLMRALLVGLIGLSGLLFAALMVSPVSHAGESLPVTPRNAAPARLAERSAPAVQDTMAQRMQACVVCHGKEGRATNAGFFPRIAGKPEAYLYHQLRNFQDGRRHNDVMSRLLENLSDDYLRDIASYFAELDLPYPAAQRDGLSVEQQRVARGLVFNGAPDKGVPACVACHGEQMAGRLPAVPGLLTLPPDYLLAQFGAWRNGLRQTAAPDCMAEIARRLSPDEIGAVARWLSAQTLPAGTKPAAESMQALPMRCGSLQ